MNRLYICLVLLTISGTGFTARCQSIPDPITVNNSPAKTRFSELESKIDQILEEAPGEIMKGIKDPGIDWASIALYKGLDEAVKSIAESTIFAPIAAEIMDLYEKEKAKMVSKEISKLRDTFKKGQEKINKVVYQRLKVKKIETNQANDGRPEIQGGITMNQGSENIDAVWREWVNAAEYVVDDGPNSKSQLLKAYYRQANPKSDITWDMIKETMPFMNTTDLKAAKEWVMQQGPETYITPAERLDIIQTINEYAKAKQAAVRTITLHTDRMVNSIIRDARANTTLKKLRFNPAKK